MQDFFTVEQIADRLMMKNDTVRSWIRKGQLKALKIGRHWRITAQELERFLKAAEV